MSYGSWRVSPRPPGWAAIARRILARDPICTWGYLFEEEDGPCYQPSTDCDHIGDRDDHTDDNLRGLCSFHHRRRTSSQANVAQARMRRERPKARPKARHPGYRDDTDDKL